jgi:hypothetical protein
METEFTPWAGLVGGALIGLAAVVLMAGLGRIAGISGIFGGLLTLDWGSETAWRAVFVAGLVMGAVAARMTGYFDPASVAFPGTLLSIAVAGIAVGTGTALGSGCTSGHGVCGLARLSPRSLVATLTFMIVAALVVFITRHVL